MSRNLLPHYAQPATLPRALNASTGSTLDRSSSRWVAGWVATCSNALSLIYAVLFAVGSKGSNFFKNLRTRGRGKERIGLTIGISCYTCYAAGRTTVGCYTRRGGRRVHFC